VLTVSCRAKPAMGLKRLFSSNFRHTPLFI